MQRWIEARKRFHLSHAQVQMARELGMNPRKLGSLANHKQEPWKAPLPIFIERLYRKRFGNSQPDRVISIEERAKEIAEKKVEKRQPLSASLSALSSVLTGSAMRLARGCMEAFGLNQDELYHGVHEESGEGCRPCLE
jgi:hypothetical protein